MRRAPVPAIGAPSSVTSDAAEAGGRNSPDVPFGRPDPGAEEARVVDVPRDRDVPVRRGDARPRPRHPVDGRRGEPREAIPGLPAVGREPRHVAVDPVDDGAVRVVVEREHVRRRRALGRARHRVSSCPGGWSRPAGSRPSAPRSWWRPAPPGTATRAAPAAAACGTPRRDGPASASAGSTSGVPRKPVRDAAVGVVAPGRRGPRPRPPARRRGRCPMQSAARSRSGCQGMCRASAAQVARAHAVGERGGPRRPGGSSPTIAAARARSRRCGRRRRWRGTPSRPWPPTVGRPVRQGRASRRTASRARAGRRRPRRASSESHPAAHAVELAAQDVAVAVGLVDGPRHDRGGVRPAGPPEARRRRRGRRRARREGTPSSSSWSSARSRSQLAQKACESNSVEPVAANAWASPVQPRRSSRCGQSVGTDTKLSRCDQTTFSWRRSSRGVRAGERGPRVAVAADGHERGARGPRPSSRPPRTGSRGT